MLPFVLDASVALSWFLRDESTIGTDRLLSEATDHGALAPSIWTLEVGNALLVAERRNRLDAEQRRRALGALKAMAVTLDSETLDHVWERTLLLAQTYGLTLYDATYLELGIRSSLPLATLDKALAAAARKAGARLALSV